MSKLKVAYQLYSARDDVEKGMLPVLKKLAKMGYDGVEFAGFFGHSAKEINEMLAETKLKAASSHVPVAEMKKDLDGVIAAAQKAIDNTRSVGIGTAPCTIPAVGHPNFTIADGMMELGIGHHGEPGVSVQPLATANEIAEQMLNLILPDLPFSAGDEVVVLLSGLGATPVMEQYIVYNRVEEVLTGKGIRVHRAYVGNYFTSLEMMGVTLTVMKLDDELKACIDYPADSMGLKQL